MHKTSVSLIILIALNFGYRISAQDLAQAPTVVETHHSAVICRSLREYTARAGTIPIRDNETGEVHANMFFVAYTLERGPNEPIRPLTFLWNGGPGSNSGLVHLLGFGPRRITKADGKTPPYSPNGTALAYNAETWLAYTDLVFVDPVGTGYSRPTKPEYGAEFYQSPGDAESVAEFIRVFRLRQDAMSAPIFLMGESYGVTRASLVSEVLLRRRIPIAGVILLSGGFPIQAKVPKHVNRALNLPIWTAAAHYHQRLKPDLQNLPIEEAIRAAQAFAENEYADALSRVEKLSSAEHESILSQLERFTGIPAAQIDAASLIIPLEQVSTSLLGGQRMVGRYDSRAIGALDTSGGPYDPTKDPSLKDILDSTSVVRYMREELNYRSDFYYQGPFGGGYPPPTGFRGDWMSVRWGSWKGMTLAVATDDEETAIGQPSQPAAAERPFGLAAAMARDFRLRAFVATGYFDLVGESYATDFQIRQLPPEIKNRVTSRIYAGGHATYTDDNARRQLSVDVAEFFQSGASQ